MSIPGQIAAALSLWIDSVANTVSARLERARGAQQIAISEDEEGALTLRLVSKASKDADLPPVRIGIVDGAISTPLSPEWSAAMKGAIVDLALRPSRFVFRPLELPGRAVEFLDGIIRAQIDRLTPWSPAEAVFHWTPPQPIADDHVELTVVATARAAVTSLSQALLDLGATAVDISTATPGMERIAVHHQRIGGQTGSSRLRFALIAVLAIAGVPAILSIGLGGIVTDSYDAEQQQIQRRIAERRAIARGSQGGPGGSAIELLARRKQTMPSAVMVLEELSGILPDHTYATELRIEGDKLQITGLTHDAPSLIEILERSPHFASAGFFAPTTRAANESGERFHIETRIKPQFGSGT
ncbi:PilN domain-containing protein [Bradyrhizobium betae]|uniref:PilN domain-containing protein n=1 Tax=Bradyrhizobium betae TaxID=244734 RepID=A0A5P6PFE6_9BRAD|nr:PilN domain-containing protein [Bradyrhizobium betae]MCS3729700.1 general secretion pathway protein L [Bradyrhizobium betae]QFI76073.1 PilN domain-containing protein [Bradyrhizobium betae]